jgi:phospholipase/lecithinase/hemolysin
MTADLQLTKLLPPSPLSSLLHFPFIPSDRYHRLLTHLTNLGARQFLLLSVPPIDLTPKYIALGTSSQKGVRAAVGMFNEKLEGMVNEFKTELSGMKGERGWVGLFDTGKVFNVRHSHLSLPIQKFHSG